MRLLETLPLVLLAIFLKTKPAVSEEEDDFTVKRIYVQYEEVTTCYINNSVEYVFVFPKSKSQFPHRVSVWSSNAPFDFPVLTVIRQERDILSWQVPLEMDTGFSDTRFRNTSRTLCHPYMSLINHIPKDEVADYFDRYDLYSNFIVAVSTSNTANIDVSVVASEQTEFYIDAEETYSITISPSQPQYVYYKFTENDTDTVLIEVDSEDDVCLTVSVQESSCPVMDLNKDIEYQGKFATVNTKGAITISKSEFPEGFFLVFVAKGDNSDCSAENSVIPILRNTVIRTQNQTSVVSFVVRSSISKQDYLMAIWITLAVIIAFSVVVLVMICLFFRYGKLARLLDLSENPDMLDHTSTKTADELYDILTKPELTVDLLSQHPKKNKKKSYNYLWHINSISLFYSIPVVQLVITYQRIVNHTGNLDTCYYNFLCAHPAIGLSDFNHVYSNIGYVVVGIMFLLLILYRQSSVTPMQGCGIPIHYGFFYAMGVALIIEGILSACYHICPSQSNYQFDLSFMYIMAILIMVKLYHNRHPDINASAYATFTVVGVGVFCAMIGILNGQLWIWLMFLVAYVCFCVYLSFKIYFFSYVWAGVSKFKDDFRKFGCGRETFAPVKKGRFILLFIANILNYSIFAAGFYSYYTGGTDFGTFLLAILMANAVLHAIFYISMKLMHKETVCLEAAIFGILALIVWGISSYFFLNYLTMWTLTPAESRQRNAHCTLLRFYDSHDIWHLLSAAAMFLTFVFLLNLDDDLATTPQEEIAVF